MAFNVKKLAGMNAGSGKAPGVFTYTTNDSVADVTTNHYWDELGLTLQIGDIIYAVVLADTAPVLSRLVINLSSSIDSKAALMDVFVGDIRATDTAGYTSDNFGGNIGAGSDQRMFTYRNNTDAIVDVIVSGYFNELAVVLKTDDLIYTITNDGANYIRVLDSVDGVVTTEAIVFVP